MRHRELLAFIRERHKIYVKKSAGEPKPWTSDEILQKYRFCNVHRELDTETKWLADNWRMRKNNDFWFAALVFRFINWHETAVELGFPVPWDPERFIAVLESRKYRELKVYSGAYMISTHGVKEAKSTYLARSLTIIWRRREELRPRPDDTCRSFYERLVQCFDLGSFLAAQVVADVKYHPSLSHASDFLTFVAPGPGSKRGLNRVLGNPVKAAWKGKEWEYQFYKLFAMMTNVCKDILPPIHAQDLQNCLCEFDKYERVRLGEGRLRSTYNGV